MSERKETFTPGPYSIRSAGGFDIAIVDSDNKIIAEVFEKVDTDTTRPVWANAHLIAAAPDMYEALTTLVERCSDGDVETPFECDIHKIEAIRAARDVIAKAEGRSA